MIHCGSRVWRNALSDIDNRQMPSLDQEYVLKNTFSLLAKIEAMSLPEIQAMPTVVENDVTYINVQEDPSQYPQILLLIKGTSRQRRVVVSRIRLCDEQDEADRPTS